MSSSPSSVENISDTAIWVAHMRALESEREDALFHDPFARQLSGERGDAMAHNMRNEKVLAWQVALRTKIIDEMLLQTIEQHGCDTVLSLAAGLDTRPYRLALPPDLHWIEIDLPAIFTYKNEQLRDEQPVCSLEQIDLDLANVEARGALFERIHTQYKRVLVLMEGLSIYLTNEQLASLVSDLHTYPEFRWLLTESITGGGLRFMRRSWDKQLAKGNAPIQLDIEDSELFYQQHGWKTSQTRLMIDEAYANNRKLPFFGLIRLATLANADLRRSVYRDIGGFALLERIDSP
ncbi:hypothetical protein KDH_71910 [Dictyobacter sp. S3.2.2.5]|uniref:S-adenosyl-L-methionine-dependent methyltransferase n=1 Tax=Dictyobacter halimunensis TaxID=3026934 RepID=A0ABQ6G522_9CHLR|nr:hypothetical protein KDH_71910 [Dictyobacter sp. S3.2.2.5]